MYMYMYLSHSMRTYIGFAYMFHKFALIFEAELVISANKLTLYNSQNCIKDGTNLLLSPCVGQRRV